MVTKFLLDSGNPDEYRKIKQFLHEQGSELWGSTTNPSLIAKQLAGHQITMDEAFIKQKELVLQILDIVPGAVSSEVYADLTTPAEKMIVQGRQINAWHDRIYVKLPTTIEGMKARTILRKEGIAINNTLVFSPQQIFAICLHEKLVQQTYNLAKLQWPCFISPFLGRIDDIGEQGSDLLEQGMSIKRTYFTHDIAWLLSASIRSREHMRKTLEYQCELITAPLPIYAEWFSHREQGSDVEEVVGLKPLPQWKPSEELLAINDLDTFMQAIESKKLDIAHPLTNKGIEKFTTDWHSIIKG